MGMGDDVDGECANVSTISNAIEAQAEGEGMPCPEELQQAKADAGISKWEISGDSEDSALGDQSLVKSKLACWTGSNKHSGEK